MIDNNMRKKREQYLTLLEEKKRRIERNQMKYFDPYPWQKRFYASGLDNMQRLLMAANQVGKTKGASFEFAFHVTGRYPEWWEGRRLDCKRAWALGHSGEQMRDNIQLQLFGEVCTINGKRGVSGTGSIPFDCIDQDSIIWSQHTKNLIKDISIKHKSGRRTTVSLKSYTQGQDVMMGPVIDLIWIDEEPIDQEIYPQALIRTTNGDNHRGGLTMMTFTPENGMTPLVTQFMNDRQKGQDLINVTWEDAPHITDEVRKQLLSSIPPHQRDMRTKGIPLLGSGQIFPINEDLIKVTPFRIPDHWKRIVGIDFGWDHPTAVVWMAIDPDTQKYYVYDCTKASERVIRDWAMVITGRQPDWIPVAWPHDGLQHDKNAGVAIAQQYADEGVNMLDERATFPDGTNSVEAGIYQLLNLMTTGRFFVFSHLSEWFDEFRMYHRDKGKIVKLLDDLMSATRYAYMMERHAEAEPYEEWEEDYSSQETNSLGY
jgi:phage terminase large subunit-like protein